MALSKEARLALRDNPPPAAAAVRDRLRNYLDATGMGTGDLAYEIGYSRVTVNFFAAGSYRRIAANDLPIRRALTDYMDVHPAVPENGVPRSLFRDRDTNLLLERAAEARVRGRIILVVGPAGTGKTAVLKWYAAARLAARDAVYLHVPTCVTKKSFLEALCRRLGAFPHGTTDRLLHNVVRKVRERKAVLLIDEAQRLLGPDGVDPFEQLRDVFDLAGGGIVLAAQYIFVRAIRNGLGNELGQWLERVDLKDPLFGLQESEITPCAKHFLGAELPPETLPDVRRACTSINRHALESTRFFEVPVRREYFSKRRLRKLTERVAELRSMPENENKPLAAIVRAAARLLLSPEGRPL